MKPFYALIFFLLGLGGAVACPRAKVIIQMDQELVLATSMATRSAIMQAQQVVKKELAQEIFDKFNASNSSTQGEFVDYYEHCLAQLPGKKAFLNLLQRSFFQQTILTLKKLPLGPSSKIQSLVGLLEEKQKNGNVTPFFIEGMADEDMKAGVHKSMGYIFMNLQKINRTEWFAIFIHETLHSLDDVFSGSNLAFNDKKNVIKILDILKEGKSFEELDLVQQNFLDEWLRAGLNRGFWAEYKAWVGSLNLYHELEQLEEFRVPFQELDWYQVMLQNTANVSKEKGLYDYLGPRFVQAEKAPLNHPLILKRVDFLKNSYSDNLKWGNLSVFR